jgi:hypothetical protein
LPSPQPMPRPTRFFGCFEPAPGFTLLSCI